MNLFCFILGFAGGFMIQFHYYLSDYNKKRVYTNQKPQLNDDEQLLEEPKLPNDWSEFRYFFNPINLLFCFFYALFGGLMAGLISPPYEFFAFYIGLTSSNFIGNITPK